MVIAVVEDGKVNDVVDVISKSAKTGEIGDGRYSSQPSIMLSVSGQAKKATKRSAKFLNRV